MLNLNIGKFRVAKHGVFNNCIKKGNIVLRKIIRALTMLLVTLPSSTKIRINHKPAYVSGDVTPTVLIPKEVAEESKKGKTP